MAKNSKKGIVYIVQNPAFPHLFKIGRTEQGSVEERGLNASNVPEDFEVLFGYECTNPKEVEEHLHKTFDGFRHYTNTGRKTEFFYVGCLPQARDTLKLLLGAKEISEDDIDDISLGEDDAEYDETRNIEQMRTKKGPLFTFNKVNIEPGTTLVFIDNDKEECKVLDSKDHRTVLYKDIQIKLSPLAQKLTGKDTCQGICYFKVKGEEETLYEKYERSK